MWLVGGGILVTLDTELSAAVGMELSAAVGMESSASKGRSFPSLRGGGSCRCEVGNGNASWFSGAWLFFQGPVFLALRGLAH